MIGKKGEDVERLREAAVMMGVPVHVNIEEIRKPESMRWSRRTSHSSSTPRAVPSRDAPRDSERDAARRERHQGMSRVVWAVRDRALEVYHEGRVPPPLRADIDYATAEAKTTYGVLGIKVWIFKGEILGSDEAQATA